MVRQAFFLVSFWSLTFQIISLSLLGYSAGMLVYERLQVNK
jgi:hypothetical protein